MKTLIILLMSSLFFSNLPTAGENDSIQKIMKVKIEKTNVITKGNVSNTRMPIIIIKRD